MEPEPELERWFFIWRRWLVEASPGGGGVAPITATKLSTASKVKLKARMFLVQEANVDTGKAEVKLGKVCEDWIVGRLLGDSHLEYID